MGFSVLISVYSKENPKYFNDALCSIYDNQTRKPCQIVLVKDGLLTEELDLCITKWKEKLSDILTVIELPVNMGLAVALNTGLKECRYELVARMDTDDISLPDRFEKQVSFMECNPDIVASSAVIEERDEHLLNCIGRRDLPLEPNSIEKMAKWRSPLSHPVSIFRKSVVQSVGGYPAFRTSQDYALWSLLLTKNYSMANMPDILHIQRAGNLLMNRRGVKFFKGECRLLRYQYNIGFLSSYEYMRNIFIRFIVRMSPNPIKSFLYKFIR